MSTTIKRTYVSTLVEEIGSLPSVAAQIVSMTSDPDCDIGQLSRIIISDSVMSMRFLALANSASLNRGQEVRNLRHALVRLGLRRVRNVALCMGMHDMMPSEGGLGSLDMKEFWKFNLAAASCAQGLAWQRGDASDDDAWLVGILHNIGIGSLQQQADPQFAAALEMARVKKIPLIDAEMLKLDFHHGEVGARMLSQWNLPPLFCEAVEYFGETYDEGEVSPEADTQIQILRGAVALVRAIGFGENGDGDTPLELPELALKMGIHEQALEALAGKVDREVTDYSRTLGMDLPEGEFLSTLEESRRQVVTLGIEGFTDSLAREDLEEEMSMARNIQQRLLPGDTPVLETYELAGANHPSRRVSGDYFDYLHFKDGRTGIVIADVSGKGMPAALLASNVQASLRALAGVIQDPGQLMAAVNDALHESTDPEKFATAFLAILDPSGTSLQYASAGHNPPLLLRQDGSCDWLKPAGTPLGMFPGMKYPVHDVPLVPGDLIITYTDGITEACDLADVEFEESGLERVAREHSALPVGDIIDHMIQAVLAHVGSSGPASLDTMIEAWVDPEDAQAGDDLTMVVVRARP